VGANHDAVMQAADAVHRGAILAPEAESNAAASMLGCVALDADIPQAGGSNNCLAWWKEEMSLGLDRELHDCKASGNVEV
jgi:hypothetical protein